MLRRPPISTLPDTLCPYTTLFRCDLDTTIPPADAATEGKGEAPQAATIAQYIKDLSVESPSSPQVFQWQTQPALDVQFGINGGKVADDVHEVILKIEIGRAHV